MLPIIQGGVRFECQQSGKCCTSRGEYGYVYLTLDDRRRLAAHHDMETREFTRTYCAKTNGHFHLRNPELDCEFLDGRRCGVYPARPGQCRSWPFWPENMNAKTWHGEIASFCPGVGKGRLYDEEEIREILRRR